MECYPDGRGAPRAPVCVEKNINSYPTWEVAGQRFARILTPKELARLSNFTRTRGNGTR